MAGQQLRMGVPPRRVAVIRRSTVLLVSAVSLGVLTACVSANPPSPRQQAVSACDAWQAAGVGDTATKPATRGQKATEAAALAAEAAARDRSYINLAEALSQAQKQLDGENNSTEALVRSPLLSRLVQLFQAAGQSP